MENPRETPNPIKWEGSPRGWSTSIQISCSLSIIGGCREETPNRCLIRWTQNTPTFAPIEDYKETRKMREEDVERLDVEESQQFLKVIWFAKLQC